MTSPTRMALQWNRGREERSRPLTPTESGMIERARQTVFGDLPETILKPKLMRTALAAIRVNQIRVRLDTTDSDLKSEFGVTTLLAKSPIELGDDGCRVAVVKIASAIVVRRRLAELLGRPLTTIDWFVSEFTNHGHLVGRAGHLASFMLTKCNTHIYMQEQGLNERLNLEPPKDKAWLPKTSLGPLVYFQDLKLTSHRSEVYGRAIAKPKATYRVTGSRALVYISEERVWRAFFGQVGVTFYNREVPHASDRRLRPSVRRLRDTGSAYLQ